MTLKSTSKGVMAKVPGLRFRAVIFCAITLALSQAYSATYTVSSTSQLQLIAASANPGDVILLAEGNYGSVTISVSGSTSNPITVKPAQWGTVKFIGAVAINGTGLLLDGFEFEGTGKLVIDNANTIQVTNCIFDDLSAGIWLQIKEGAYNVTVDHNAFTDKDTQGQLLQMRMPPSGEMDHVIRKNYFANIAYGGGENQYETIQIGQQEAASDRVTDVLVEHNLFERADGESEIISVKASGNTIRYNTFRQSKGSLVFRHGNDNRAEGNIFLGEGVSSTGGIRFQGDDHVIVNNYFEGLTGTGHRAPLAIMDGVSGANPLYDEVNTATVAFNSFIDCSPLKFSTDGEGTTIPPEDLRFRNNLLLRTSGSASLIEIDDQLDAPTFEGNIYFGSGLGFTSTGFENTDPEVVRIFAGLLGPDAGSPLIDASVSMAMTLDLFGRTRSGTADVGAVEGITNYAPYQPLDKADVGPVIPPSPVEDLAWLVPLINLILF